MLTFIASLAVVYGLLCALIYTQQERMVFYPEVLPPSYAFAFDQPFEEVALPVDGATLSALHFTVERPRGAILFFHGNAGSLRDWGTLADHWTRHGYAVLMLDYRGYGKSSGAIRSEQMLHDDALAAYTWLAERYPADSIGVAGRSLGTGIAVRLAVQVRPRMLILETPYVSLLSIARRQVAWAPGFLFKYPLRSERWIGQVECPIYLIHGTNDELIPFASSERLAALIGGERRLFPIAGAGHNDFTAYPAYDQALAAILGPESGQ